MAPVPIEPPPCRWSFPAADEVAGAADDEGLVGVGADLLPGTLLAAYRQGLFPMPLGRRGPIGWFAPDPRGVLPLPGLRVSRSLRQSVPRFAIRVDTAFDEVVTRCADPRRPHGWITHDVRVAYGRLHRLGWAHSVEAWTSGPGRPVLVGGLYGVAIGGLFAGESMFHAPGPAGRDASKVALLALVRLLGADRDARRLLDVQWPTPHLRSLGAVPVERTEYLRRLAVALAAPLPEGLYVTAATKAEAAESVQ
jgi:leucyl/phenylalanyl-tRNA--protein transferase